jgi:hypothetical protein
MINNNTYKILKPYVFWLFFWLFMSGAALSAKAAYEGGLTSLSASVVIEKIPVGKSENEAAHKASYNELIKSGYIPANNHYDEYAKGLLEYNYGFKFRGLSDYVFVPIGTTEGWKNDGEYVRKVCAVNYPDVSNSESLHHIVFRLPAVDSLESPWQLLHYGVVENLEKMFSNDKEARTAERLPDIIPIAMYIFYWRQVNHYSGLYFSEISELTDGFIICDNPMSICDLDLYYKISDDIAYLVVDTELALSFLPTGESVDDKSSNKGAYRSFYTWDVKTRIVRYWIFGIDPDNGVHIKDVVVGVL